MARITSFIPLFTALACAAAILPTAAQTAASSATSSGLPAPTLPQGAGINIHFTDPKPGEMKRFAEAGFGIARMDLAWARIESQKGVYDFSAYDRLLGHLNEAGARALFILDYGNDLYQKGAPTTPEARAAFARFAAAAAKHYAGKGVLFELWNEPNLDGFWRPKANAREYATLAVGAARAMRAAEPGVTIIGPGSSGFPWPYLETVFQSGLLELIDGVSIHPYRGQSPETAAEDFARLRTLIARYAPKGKEYLPILSSEWGYSTNIKAGVAEDVQAAYLTRMWLSNLAAGVNLSVFYDWKDDGPDPTENEHRFGTVHQDLTPKPAFTAASALITSLRGYTFRHRLARLDATDWALLFQRGDSNALAVVTWKAIRGAPGEAGMPKIRKVAPTDPDFPDLRRLASVRLPAGVRVESTNLPVALRLTVRNPERGVATVALLTGAGVRSKPASVRYGTAAQTVLVPLPSGASRAPSRSEPVRITWNGRPLPELFPVTVLRLDPLAVAVAPRGSALLITVDNPGKTAFTGTVIGEVSGVGTPPARVPLKIAAGQEQATVRLPLPPVGRPFAVRILDAKSGAAVTATDPAALLPFTNFPNGYHKVDYIENVAQPPASVTSIALTDPEAPAAEGLEFRYTFDPGWRYTQLIPGQQTEIPFAAKALLIWVKADGSGNALRARYRDQTGQTFQVDLPALNWTGWRLVTIPLDGSGAGTHWGGANDGKLHRPLAWEGVALIDSTSRESPRSGTLLFAGATYLASPTALPAMRGVTRMPPPPPPPPSAQPGASPGAPVPGSTNPQGIGFPFGGGKKSDDKPKNP